MTLTTTAKQAILAHILDTITPEGPLMTGVTAGKERAWARNQREAYDAALRKAKRVKA